MNAKRIFDIFFSSIVLFFSLPLFIIFSLIIKLEEGSPVFFKQKRVGRFGKEFIILKFRTMKNIKGPILTSSSDKRITKIGRLLRRTNFDEIPQFINIIKGEMSVLGPRPEIPEIVRQYNDKQRNILKFKPGFTSPATVKFIYEEKILDNKPILDYYLNNILPKKISIDLDYFSKRYNFFRDFLIILKTIGKTFDE